MIFLQEIHDKVPLVEVHLTHMRWRVDTNLVITGMTHIMKDQGQTEMTIKGHTEIFQTTKGPIQKIGSMKKEEVALDNIRTAHTETTQSMQGTDPE